MIKIDDKIIQILDENEKIILEQKYFSDEFLWILYDNKITINRETNEIFYDELNKIFENEYVFQENIPSKKTKNKIVWLSDQYCDIEDEYSLSKINRLIIEKKNNTFIIRIENPLLEKLKISKKINVIAFSPLYNGYFSRNQKTNSTFQDDIVMLYQKILHNKQHVLKF